RSSRTPGIATSSDGPQESVARGSPDEFTSSDRRPYFRTVRVPLLLAPQAGVEPATLLSTGGKGKEVLAGVCGSLCEGVDRRAGRPHNGIVFTRDPSRLPMLRPVWTPTALALVVLMAIALGGCSKASAPAAAKTHESDAASAATPDDETPLEGMPPLLDPDNIYAAARAGNLSPTVADFPSRVYVPNTVSNTVDVIDPVSFKVVGHFAVGREPQHITPSYDLKHLWVLSDLGDSVTEIDPATGAKGKTIWVKDPYNMYYTPDGHFAVVVAEREARLNFLDPVTMKMRESLRVPCHGIDHMDFSANGRFLIASCEFAAALVKVDVAARRVLGMLTLEPGGMP